MLEILVQMKRLVGIALLACAVESPALAQTTSGPVFSGTVVDAHGKPVVDVEVAQSWLAGSNIPSGFRASYGGTRTDAKGTFQTKIYEDFPATVFAFDSKGQRGAVVVISESARALRVRLEPLRRVHYRFEGAGLTDLSQSRIRLHPVSGPVFSQIGGPAEGILFLPPGKYGLTIDAPGGTPSTVNFEVTTHDLTLDPIPLAAGIFQLYGYPAPSLSDVEPINAAPFSVDGLRGKWVLVYFWGYWCWPCVSEGLPELAHFYDENLQNRARFEIVAVHENGVAGKITTDELRNKVVSLEREKWGKPLPFPIVLDRSGDTIKIWGIVVYPTVALITPTGELRRGDLDRLRQELERR